MKYSIRGIIETSDDTPIINVLNNYRLWRLITNKDIINKKDITTFEVWLNYEMDKDNLFKDLKAIVDQYGHSIDWHLCTHDEPTPTSCVIEEEYIKEEGK